ncbi:acyl-CoA dehydrogenase family protein [Bosea vestrisii]|uniref:acyl-CoA dehydrogenase family protein n=1 Tax=Bosea vestrisii TaxID=151416 RepID=UPI0024DFB610|nr:acyl-CoA dehydrogenase family protein [Bosea vestrisii]WID95736.1 acyl-CoA dehydrogenase family protein [Bosea vestrisii]
MDLSHLDLPFFEAPHRDLAQDFADWAIRDLHRFQADEGGDGKTARAIFEMLGASRWLDPTAPSDVQTSGFRRFDLRSICLLREISAYCSGIADVSISEPWLGMLPIMLAGSRSQLERYLDGYLSGRLLPAFALSEPEAGSDARAITTSARRSGDQFILNGRKTWTSNAGLADLYVVFARTEPAGGISAFLVDGKNPGLRLEERVDVMSPHTVGTWVLDECRVPADAMLGEEGQGFDIAMHALEVFRPTVGAATLGFAKRAMHEATGRSLTRSAFKKPIADHQMIQGKLADMAVAIDASALLVYKAAWQYDLGQPLARSASIAKLFSTEACFQIVDQAVQIFGGLGVARGTVERLFRHTRAFRIFDGTSEIQRLIIAKDVLKNYDSGHEASGLGHSP